MNDYDAEIEKMIQETEAITEAIDNDFKNNNREPDVTHAIKCPACGKEATYSISSYNGHRRYNCECSSFME